MKISIGKSRRSTSWKTKDVPWSWLEKRLSEVTRTHETVQEYRKMSVDEQSKIKDIGGFVGGPLSSGHRSNATVQARSLVTLDADYADMTLWDTATLLYENAMLVYSTHKHTPENPRLRLVIPLSREVSPDEYEAIARKIGESIGMETFDDTTYQPARLMYWPSASKDGDFYFKTQAGDFLDPEEILSQYIDWRDCEEWPISSREKARRRSKAKQQADPTSKQGIVGAFCRTYTISEAIEKFLSDVYTPTDKDDRYTYAEGTTAAGLVIYDDVFAYSNHSTDPAGGQLCNAFDLVRIHLFGDEDPIGTEDSGSSLKSYRSMVQFVSNDDRTKITIGKEKAENSDFDSLDLGEFEADQHDSAADPDAWMSKLELGKSGSGYAATRQNVVRILENDPQLKGCFAYDELAQTEVACRSLPWRRIGRQSERYLRDSDDASLRVYIEAKYRGADMKEKIKDGLKYVSAKKTFHPVRKYLEGLVWDGTERIDTLLIDYLNAEDSAYTRAVTRKTLLGAVYRVMEPGCKFDQMLTISGPQGIGKSTLWAKLGGEWFSDSLSSLSGDKNAMESIQGVWIMEIGELSAMKKSEVEAIKAFISKKDDFFRAAFAERKELRPRQLIFIGTTNETNFLRDETGNRRFWVVDVDEGAKKSVWEDLTEDEIGQIWAEAVEAYRAHETVTLTKELEEQARQIQKDHSEDAPKMGMLEEYLNMKIPHDWYEWTIDDRRTYIHENEYIDKQSDDPDLMSRSKVCAAEIWVELYKKDLADLSRMDTKEINQMLKNVQGWKPVTSAKFGEPYGTQRGFRRSTLSKVNIE